MRKSRSSSRFWAGFLGAAVALAAAGPVLAYHEEVGADVQEVYAAALDVLKDYGIDKQDKEKFTIETDWVEARSERSKSLVLFKIQKSYVRRTRFKLTFKRWPRYTEIDIRAEYKFKPFDASDTAPWRKMKPKFQDYNQERELFRKILAQIEFNRRTSKIPSGAV